MAEKVLRKFRQINKAVSHFYAAEEIRFVQISEDEIRCISILNDGSKVEGPSMSKKFYDLNMDGFETKVPMKSGLSGGPERIVHHVGMLKNPSFEEIV